MGSKFIEQKYYAEKINTFDTSIYLCQPKMTLLNTICLIRITNKYSFYFRFIKYLLYPTYILNLKKKKE